MKLPSPRLRAYEGHGEGGVGKVKKIGIHACPLQWAAGSEGIRLDVTAPEVRCRPCRA